MDTNTAAAIRIHPFEKAGLGKAPFRCVGVEVKVGPINLGNGATAGSPGQPMGSCQYCGTGIRDCYWIVSADAKRFYVGCDCVRKVESKGTKLLTEVEEQVKALKKQANEERIRKAMAAYECDPCIAAYFESGDFAGSTYNRYIAFCRQNAGVSGMLKIARSIERAIAAVANQPMPVALAAAPVASKALCDRKDFPF